MAVSLYINDDYDYIHTYLAFHSWKLIENLFGSKKKKMKQLFKELQPVLKALFFFRLHLLAYFANLWIVDYFWYLNTIKFQQVEVTSRESDMQSYEKIQ